MAKKREKTSVILVMAVALAALLSACATTKAPKAEDQLRGLEREITRLRAERSALEARNSSLDDKLIVMEKKLGNCSTHSEAGKDLSVVRLSPSQSQQNDRHESYEKPLGDYSHEPIKENRPLLSLRGSSPARSTSRSSSPSRPSSAKSSIAFDNLGADNLGVVTGSSAGGGAHMAPAPASSGPMEQFQVAYRAYSNKKYDEALRGLGEFIQVYPGHSYTDNAIFWRGECYLAKGKMLKAIGEFERLIGRFPRSEKVPSGMYRIGFVYDQLRDRQKALEYYFKVVDRHPGTDAARKASRRVAVLKNGGLGGNYVTTKAKR